MVLVPMGNHNASNLFLILFQIGKIRNNQVNPQHISIRESHAAVDNQNILAIFINSQVLSDLIQTTQRNNAKGWFLSFAGSRIISAAASLRRRGNQIIIRFRRQNFFLDALFFHIDHTDSAGTSRPGTSADPTRTAAFRFLFALCLQGRDICRTHHQFRQRASL